MNASEAFDILMGQLERAIEVMRGKVIESTQKGHFTDAQKLAGKAEEITQSIVSLKQLRGRWDELCEGINDTASVPQPVQTRRRVRNGARTPEVAFRIPILQALEECGGSGRVMQILNRIGEIMKPKFNPTDYEKLTYRNEVRWQNTARWVRNKLVNDGLMKSSSPKGIWEISEAGREYLRQHKA